MSKKFLNLNKKMRNYANSLQICLLIQIKELNNSHRNCITIQAQIWELKKSQIIINMTLRLNFKPAIL